MCLGMQVWLTPGADRVVVQGCDRLLAPNHAHVAGARGHPGGLPRHCLYYGANCWAGGPAFGGAASVFPVKN